MQSSVTDELLVQAVATHGAPLYVYSQKQLYDRARAARNLQAPFGLTVRYAVKANPHPEILTLFNAIGLHFDASSSYEAAHLLALGIAGNKISLSSQQPAYNLPELLAQGVQYVATSLRQLQLVALAANGSEVPIGLRVNPGIGSGQNNRCTTGGVGSSFGLWHEYLEEALAVAASANLLIQKLHVHIGSGTDPAVWGSAMETALALVERMPEVTTLDIGGGYKVKRAAGEQEANLSEIMTTFSTHLETLAQRTGRQLHLEIEPGTWLVAHAGVLLAEVVDIVDTGRDGYAFLRVSTGMNDFLRPTLYGAQHGIRVLNKPGAEEEYIVVGHNCETGDILTPAPGDSEHLLPRRLPRVAIGDIIVIEDVGAYCASLRAKGYNSFPDAQEIMLN